MRCCPRSPFLSPLWAEMPYHRFGNSVVQHRAHPVETLRRMARRHSRPSPRPYMRTGRSGVRPDGVFHLGRHRHSRHAVKARRIVRTDVRAGRFSRVILLKSSQCNPEIESHEKRRACGTSSFDKHGHGLQGRLHSSETVSQQCCHNNR